MPAVWLAFARQSAWKAWFIAAQFVVIGLLLAALIGLTRRDPDVVVVSSDGKSTYLEQAATSASLAHYTYEQKHEPSPLTVVRFSKDFIETFVGLNSSTVGAAWHKSLEMMDGVFREQMQKEAEQKGLVSAIKAAQAATSGGPVPAVQIKSPSVFVSSGMAFVAAGNLWASSCITHSLAFFSPALPCRCGFRCGSSTRSRSHRR